MIHCTNIYKLDNFNKHNTVVVADFDGTITDHKSRGSWGLFHNKEFLSEEFCNELSRLYKHYRPIETDSSLSYEEKEKILPLWWEENINQIIDYKISEEVIKKLSIDRRLMDFRIDADKFINFLSSQNIPLLINSAGIGNFIKEFLIYNNCYTDNVHILSNMIEFSNGIASGITGDIITTFNKNYIMNTPYVKTLLSEKENILLLGNSIGDSFMTIDSINTYKIGFLDSQNYDDEYIKYFDSVCKQNSSYTRILEKTDMYNRLK